MDRDELIESAASAYRERRGDGSIAESPAWHDLDPGGRLAAHERALASRELEAATHDRALSTTTRAVLRLIRGG